MNNKICIHKYLTKCKTTELPPGLGDFLRGTISLLIFSKIYNYTFFIDKSIHPFFSYFKDSKYYIHDENNNNNDNVIELLPCNGSWEEIYKNINNLFNLNESFSIITNSFYSINTNGFLENYGTIPDDIQLIMRDILQPTDKVEEKIDEVFKNIYKIDKDDKYKVIHLRIGDDKLIFNKSFEHEFYSNYYNRIMNYINNNEDVTYILITDSIQMGMLLLQDIPKLLYWNNHKIHIGGLHNYAQLIQEQQGDSNIFSGSTQTENNIDNELFDTVVDFIIISRCSEIISNNSGFSLINSCIYNIKYTTI